MSKKKARLTKSLTALACSLLLFVPALAQEASRINVPAGDLIAALESLANQLKVNLVYQAGEMKGLQTDGVNGNLTPREAVMKLLEGTPLQLKTDEATGAMMISRPTTVVPPHAAPKGSSTHPATTQVGYGASEKVRAQRQKGVELQEVVGNAIPEILITDSKSLNMDIRRSEDDAQPYVIFSREAIENSGATSIEDFLKKRLTMNTLAQENSQLTTIAGGRSQINLRGLGTNQTLILIDGHRAASTFISTQFQQSDLNGIPLSAVERIEVLPTTASGIYGGGATGGVVNVVLRRDYSGAQVKLTYDNSFEADSAGRRADLSAGFNFEEGKTNLLFAGSYFDSNSLFEGDRDFVERGRAAIRTNNPSAYFGVVTSTFPGPPPGSTPNLRSADGSPLFGPGTSYFTSVPVGYAGGGGIAPLQANAATFNFELPETPQVWGTQRALTSAQVLKSLMVTVRREFTPTVQAFFEGRVSHDASHMDAGASLTSFTVAATAPNNPFGKNLLVTIPFPVNAPWESSIKGRRAVGGIIVRLPGQWQAEVDYTWDRSTWSRFNPSAFMTAAGTAAINNGTLDVLRDLNAFPIDFTPYLSQGVTTSPSRSTMKDVTLRLAGSVGALPAGRPTLSALIERRDEIFGESSIFRADAEIQFNPRRDQSVDSVYLETKVPVVSEKNAIPGIRDLELQLAARYDDYTVNGGPNFTAPGAAVPRVTGETSSIHPTVGLRYQPLTDMTVRASWGTGFLPPDVNQLLPINTSTTQTLFDPRRGEQPFTLGTVGGLISGGNPNLNPEESESTSIGLILTPRFLPGTRLSVDYTRIEKTDNISTFPGGTQALINAEASFTDRIIRGPAPGAGDPFPTIGPITAVNATLMNLARAEVEASDVQLDYGLETIRMGRLDFFALGTWQTKHETQTMAGQPITDRAGISTAGASIPLKFKANAGLTWGRHSWKAGWNARYYDSYRVAFPMETTTIANQGAGGIVSSQIYHDVFASWSAPANMASAILGNTEINLGVRNILNKRPPYDAGYILSYYSPLGDPRLATYYLSLRRSF